MDLFMVLSGYLITRLLLQESDRTAQIDVPAFWIRRAKRLLPAAVTLVLVVTGVAALVFSADRLGNVRIDALAATFYLANWRFILRQIELFRLVLRGIPISSPLVTGDRGAVLRAVARRRSCRTSPARIIAVDHRSARRRIGCVDVGLGASRRPVTHLLRHRHAARRPCSSAASSRCCCTEPGDKSHRAWPG